jgi:hypothetical protein
MKIYAATVTLLFATQAYANVGDFNCGKIDSQAPAVVSSPSYTLEADGTTYLTMTIQNSTVDSQPIQLNMVSSGGENWQGVVKGHLFRAHALSKDDSQSFELTEDPGSPNQIAKKCILEE